MRPVTKVSFDPVFGYGLEEVVWIVFGLRLVGLPSAAVDQYATLAPASRR
jgi:hypothetical protein